MNTNILGQWPRVAKTFLQAIGHPLRPIHADISGFSAFADPIIQRTSNPSALILGVTPELYHLLHPRCQVSGMDRTEEMIRYIWPGNTNDVYRGDWLNLSKISGSFDIIVVDGGLHLLDFPTQQALLLAATASKLNPGGRFIARLFAPPKHRESVSQTWEAANLNQIPSVNHLKMRLVSALQTSLGGGVELHQVWSEVNDHRAILNKLEGSQGWSKEEIDALELYRDLSAQYALITVDQLVQMVQETTPALELTGNYQPEYPFGEQFPILCFSKDP